MIELFKEGDTALVAYAGSAFTISPLTNDATTLTNLIPSLSPDIMPDKGSNVLAGLDMAKELLTQAGYIDGDIILVTDGIDQEEQSDITSFTSNSSYRLNIYGVGTEQGAPIKLPEGGFLKDSYGQIVIPTINITRLKSLATRSGGKFALYQPSSSDIATFAPSANSELLKGEKQSHALWRIDAGIYGLLILLPLGLYLFRSAAFVGAFLVLSVLPTQQASALELPSFLKNTDQQALDAYKNKDFERAVNADSSSLKGSALYQQGNFDAALEAFSKDKSATGFYNYANALAKSGQLEQAIDAYKQAQTLQPNFSEAADNQALVEQLLEQQQQQEGDSQDNQQQSDQSEQQNNQQSDQNQQGENSDSQSEQNQGEQSQEQQGEPGDESDTEQDQQSAESGSQSDKQNEPELETQPQANQEQKQPEQTNEEQAENTQPQTAQQQTLTDEQKQNAQQQAAQAQASELTNEEKEKAQQLNQLLRKVPDDPAILLRNKMQLEAQKRQYQRRPTGVEKSW